MAQEISLTLLDLVMAKPSIFTMDSKAAFRVYSLAWTVIGGVSSPIKDNQNISERILLALLNSFL
jgi:hypothetical protein